jgi:monoamine oxidase
MQHNDIRFNPPIPSHVQAFQELGFGGVIKFLLEFSEPVWETNKNVSLKNASFIFSDSEIPTWWTRLPDKVPILTGWLGGPSAVYSTGDKNILYDRAIASLQRILKCTAGDIERSLQHWHIADWVKDPFARGAYTYPTLKSREAASFLRKGLEDTVFFAGEALYDGESAGTVEAAFVNGRDAARHICSLKS